jgi:hypothetical protein
MEPYINELVDVFDVNFITTDTPNEVHQTKLMGS